MIFSKPRVWRNAVVTPKVCAEWYGREVHCFFCGGFAPKFRAEWYGAEWYGLSQRPFLCRLPVSCELDETTRLSFL